MRVCPSCGEENPDRFRLCGFCGSALTPAAPPQELRKTVTIVFSDLKGSTSLGEALDSESLREVMTRYFEEMQAALERHGGVVEKFIGDAVMAVFGIPRAHEDDALRAVRAALDMKTALERLNRELETFWGVQLANRTGVNTGEVVSGDAGSGQRLVTGDAVNVAARLEQAAPHNEILIGEPTYRLVKDAVEVETVEPLALKGKSEPVPAFRLLAVTKSEALTRHLDAPMVGRGAELAHLRSESARSQTDRRCRLVTIMGEAGAGKSRLLGEFLAGVAEDTLVLRGRCLSYGEGITFWPLTEVVRAAASYGEDDSAEYACARIAALCSGDAEVSDRVAAAIGLSSSSYPVEEMFFGARKLLESLSRRAALVVVFEDIHWGEPVFLDFIEHFGRASFDGSLLLIATARRELLEERPDWLENTSAASTITLEALSDAESMLVIENLLGEAGLPPEAGDRIVKAAGGNPLFVEQMLSMMLDEALLSQDEEGRWTLASTDLGAPSSISALIAARLDRLPEEERSVLGRAAVVGQNFYVGAVRKMSPEEMRLRVGGLLTALTQRSLIALGESFFAGEESFSFRHALIQDNAYNGLLKKTRAELHEAFATWLERAAGARIQEYEEILGYHLERAFGYRASLGPVSENARRLAERAARLLISAGRRAFARGDMPASANLLKRASVLLDEGDPVRLELAPLMGEALMALGRLGEAEDGLEQAVHRARTVGDRRLEMEASLVLILIRYLTDPQAHSSEVLALCEEAVPVFEAVGDQSGLARSWRMVATVHGTACRYAEAEQALRKSIDHARLSGDVRQQLRTLPQFALPAVHGPIPVAEAIVRCEELLEHTTGDRRSQAQIMCSLAHLHAKQGGFERARKLYQRSRAIFEDAGEALLAAFISLDSAEVELLAGNAEGAERELRRDYEALHLMGETYALSTTAAMLADVLCRRGRFKEARLITQLSEGITAPDDVETQALWRTTRAMLLVDSGNCSEAVKLAEQGVEFIGKTDALDAQAHALVVFAQVLRAAGEETRAQDALQTALSLQEAKGNVVAAAATRAALGLPVSDPAPEIRA
ncbi:MAG: AAA family ATPase [Actinomycetota bacterium]|nr:AAA family ATPase [Actinomycetota bacterium]